MRVNNLVCLLPVLEEVVPGVQVSRVKCLTEEDEPVEKYHRQDNKDERRYENPVNYRFCNPPPDPVELLQ